MSRADILSDEIDNIVEALRVSMATAAEALARRSDELADLALGDAAALAPAMRATAITYIYGDMQDKLERVMRSPEQVEAIISTLENDNEFNGGTTRDT